MGSEHNEESVGESELAALKDLLYQSLMDLEKSIGEVTSLVNQIGRHQDASPEDVMFTILMTFNMSQFLGESPSTWMNISWEQGAGVVSLLRQKDQGL